MSLPEGWVKFVDRLETVGARKWFGDHYKTVEVSKTGGDLVAAATAVEQEVSLRARAATDAANAHADALEAQAAAVREAGDVSAVVAPVPDVAPPADAVHEIAEPVAPVVVPSIEELRAEADKLATEIAELEAKDSGEVAQPEAQPSGDTAADQTGEPAA